MKNKSVIAKPKQVPAPKVSGVVRNTPEWADAVKQIEQGKTIEIVLPLHLNGSIQHPVTAFMAALKRKYRRSYQIYARNGVIYAIPKS